MHITLYNHPRPTRRVEEENNGKETRPRRARMAECRERAGAELLPADLPLRRLRVAGRQRLLLFDVRQRVSRGGHA